MMVTMRKTIMGNTVTEAEGKEETKRAMSVIGQVSKRAANHKT